MLIRPLEEEASFGPLQQISPDPRARSAVSDRRLADFFTLTKPGISFMTGLTALAGYMLASPEVVDRARLVHTVIGTFLVSAGACALNMVLEIEVDARMHRTENRPLPSRRLLPGEALLFGGLLAVGGVAYLGAMVNGLTAFLAGLTLCIYIYLYTPLKKISALCTAVGAVSGALPPVMGWAAATGRLAPGAWVLFAILFFWQFPHFLALAWMYKDDYKKAGLYMLPALETDGHVTARAVLAHCGALLGVSLLPAWAGLAGPVYLATALVLGVAQAFLGWRFFEERSPARARGLFLGSVAYLPLLITLLVLDRRFPVS